MLEERVFLQVGESCDLDLVLAVSVLSVVSEEPLASVLFCA